MRRLAAVLVGGSPATGKSTLAAALAPRLDAALLDLDVATGPLTRVVSKLAGVHDLDDPVLAESFLRGMDLICRQHGILVNMMPSPETGPMFSGPAPDRVDDLYGHLGGHILWNSLRELEIQLQRRGVRFSLVRNEALSAQLITQYLTVKRRQLL